MPLRVSNLRLGLTESEQALPEHVARALGITPGDIRRWRILRKSLDARDKDDLAFVYAAEIVVPDESHLLTKRRPRREVTVEPYTEPPFEMPPPGSEALSDRPVVIGSGPAGLAAAYFLAQQGYRPLLLERGAPVSERIQHVKAFDEGGPHNPESNYLFGEGGAGTFSDGKLTCRGSGPDVRRILELYAECKGKPSILYDHRPHLGSNRLPAVVKAQRQRIQEMGGEIRFHCRVDDFDIAEGRMRGLFTSSGYLSASVVILAIGHSARDTYEALLKRGVPMVPKPFQIGVRIEQPQEQINRHCYGKQHLEDQLGAANYTVIAKTSTLDVFSFCMCAGGYVMPSVSEPGYFCTNGMSLSKHDTSFANSGLVVTLEPRHFGGSHPLSGMQVQREFEGKAFALSGEKYLCPIQWAADFLAPRRSKGKVPSSYPRGVLPVDLREVIPPVIAQALEKALPVLDRKWRGLFLKEATLVGPESRGSAPVRVPRDDHTRTSPGVDGLFPVGEGAGYAGGIISAAVDGLRTAKAVIGRYAPVERVK
jgi:uncharacterized protein